MLFAILADTSTDKNTETLSHRVNNWIIKLNDKLCAFVSLCFFYSLNQDIFLFQKITPRRKPALFCPSMPSPVNVAAWLVM